MLKSDLELRSAAVEGFGDFLLVRNSLSHHRTPSRCEIGYIDELSALRRKEKEDRRTEAEWVEV